jgi:hypothetical protein
MLAPARLENGSLESPRFKKGAGGVMWWSPEPLQASGARRPLRFFATDGTCSRSIAM